jgi:Phosphoesterase family
MGVADRDQRSPCSASTACAGVPSVHEQRDRLDHTRQGDLAAVSWIDPNFVDFSFFGPPGSNDDHPPSDVMAGQELVFKTYYALVRGPLWKKTLPIVTYDASGGTCRTGLRSCSGTGRSPGRSRGAPP